MNSRDIAQLRLVHQQIAPPRSNEPGEVVRALGAMQAQDYLGAPWAIGLRLTDGTEAIEERAVEKTKDHPHLADARHAAFRRS